MFEGITILAKNAALMFEGTKVNVVDTPGWLEIKKSCPISQLVTLHVDTRAC